jgi:hypothetical protein
MRYRHFLPRKSDASASVLATDVSHTSLGVLQGVPLETVILVSEETRRAVVGALDDVPRCSSITILGKQIMAFFMLVGWRYVMWLDDRFQGFYPLIALINSKM